MWAIKQHLITVIKQTWQCNMYPILGETDKEMSITSRDTLKANAISMMLQARHQIDLFTPDLEADIYDNSDVEQLVIQLIRKHRDACIRILLQDSTRAVSDGHCLVRLSQKLTSSVFIRTPPDNHRGITDAFLIVDRTGLIRHTPGDTRNYQATVNYKAPLDAASQAEIFEQAWQHSTPDIQTRRVYL